MAAATPGRMGEPQGGVRSSRGRRSTPGGGDVWIVRGVSKASSGGLDTSKRLRVNACRCLISPQRPTRAAELDGLQLGAVAAKAKHHHLGLGAVHIPLHALQAGGHAG